MQLGKLRRMACGLALIAVIGICSCMGGKPGGVLVIPLTPNARHAGKTYGEWSVAWWQWALGQPVTGHPLFEATGQNASHGQTGNVWFLGATFGDPPSVARVITVPEGTAFFFPLLNWEEDSAFAPDMTVDEMTNEIQIKSAQISELHLTVDGVAMPELVTLQAKSPAPFSVSLPAADDVYTYFGVDAGSTVSTVVSNGYWAFIDALPPGQHVITFGGTQTDGFSVSASYTITVLGSAP